VILPPLVFPGKNALAYLTEEKKSLMTSTSGQSFRKRRLAGQTVRRPFIRRRRGFVGPLLRRTKRNLSRMFRKRPD